MCLEHRSQTWRQTVREPFGELFQDLFFTSVGYTACFRLLKKGGKKVFTFLLIAIVLTGVGAALSLDMRLIPNPGDGIVQTLSDFSGGSVGLTKNCFDIGNVLLTSAIGLLMAGQLVGIGLGTILSMIGVGRVIAVFNHFYFHKTAVLAGLQLS